MKFDQFKAFPYPVLRPYSDDYLDAEFQADVGYEISKAEENGQVKEKIKFSIGYQISSPEILNEIAKGNATFISVISCRDTYFQSEIFSKEMRTEAEFDATDLRGEVRINPYVVVKNEITSFASPDINPEFGEGPFKFETGDVLAQDDVTIYYLDRDLFKPITSVFELVKKDEQSDGVWTIFFGDNHVQIEVSPKMKEAIDLARNKKSNKVVLINSIYFAAVMQAIQKLKESPGDYSDCKWAKVITQQAYNKGCDLEQHDAYLVAERLMQHPAKLLENYVFKKEEE